MDTKIYEYLISIEKNKNLTRAADECYVSQSALSQQLKKYETKLGYPLFERINNQMIPTRYGKIVLNYGKHILQVERDTEHALEQLADPKKITLKLFVDPHLKEIFTKNIYPKFHERYPDIKINIIIGDSDMAIEALTKDYVDIGFFPYQKNLPNDLNSITLDENEYHMISYDECMHETLILLDTYSYFSYMPKTIIDEHQFKFDQTIYCTSMQDIIKLVETKKGIALLPDVVIALFNKTCIEKKLDPPYYFRHLIVWPKKHKLDNIYVFLADLFIEHYQKIHI